MLNKKLFRLFLLTTFFLSLSACNLLRGTEAWCEYMEEKDKLEWSVKDMTAYAEHCVFED